MPNRPRFRAIASRFDCGDVNPQPGEREQQSAPPLAAWFQVGLVWFPVPVVGKIDFGKLPVGRVERLVE